MKAKIAHVVNLQVIAWWCNATDSEGHKDEIFEIFI